MKKANKKLISTILRALLRMITEHMELSHIKSVFIWESLMSSSFWGKVKKKMMEVPMSNSLKMNDFMGNVFLIGQMAVFLVEPTPMVQKRV